MKTKPDPSLCDTCQNASAVKGGYASSGEYDCPQRYCSEFHIAIHFSGRDECDKYKEITMKRICPKCGNDEFEITCDAHDQCSYFVEIGTDGSIETTTTSKEYCGDTDWHGNAECSACGCNLNVETGGELEAGVEILPYSVLLLYPPGTWPIEKPETYFEHTMAKDVNGAIEKIQRKASDANGKLILPEEFMVIAVFQGHLEIEMGVSQ